MTLIKVPDIALFDFSTLIPPQKKRDKLIFIKKEEQTKKFVGDYIGYVIRGRTVAEAWLKILDTILRFGKESGTHYDDMQKEIVNLMSVISDEDPNDLHVPEFFPSDKQHVNEYIPRMTKDLSGGTSKNEYTYGSRMRSWFGIDQVKGAIEKLIREPVSRAVVISLWDTIKDLTLGGSPCLNHIWLRVNENKLYMTAIFRSHDMFEGYPENALALRCLQEEIRKQVEDGLKAKGQIEDIKLGNLIILSQSAHIYDDSWERCIKTVEMYGYRYFGLLSELDPRGNLIINVEDDEIVIEHTSASKETLGIYKAKSAEEMRDILIKEKIISLVPHALDIGLELMKAEIAIKLNVHYIQDNKLNLVTKLIVEKPIDEKPIEIQKRKEDITLLKQSKEQLSDILNNLKTR